MDIQNIFALYYKIFKYCTNFLFDLLTYLKINIEHILKILGILTYQRSPSYSPFLNPKDESGGQGGFLCVRWEISTI